MLNDQLTLLQPTLSASAEAGRAAESLLVELVRTRDKDGRVVRESKTNGLIHSITQSTTKEFPSGIRSLVRTDRPINGDIPASSAYIVISGTDSVNGRTSMKHAAVALLMSLLSMKSPFTESSWIPEYGPSSTTDPISILDAFGDVVDRLTIGEA